MMKTIKVRSFSFYNNFFLDFPINNMQNIALPLL